MEGRKMTAGQHKGSGGPRAGAGRKPKYGDINTSQATVSLPSTLLAQLDAESVKLGLSRSEVLVQRLLQSYR